MGHFLLFIKKEPPKMTIHIVLNRSHRLSNYPIRYAKDENEVNKLKEKAKSFTPEIARLRKDLVYCEAIEECSIPMTKFINEKENRRTRNYERN